ncbi:uncharacterized protein perm1b [Pempheris klunzingeri]|uniref:uncharacterized protein perm1b n=1 Tax=Pempheris klunzingeri TaxID=3127111 RepID=UPI003981767C
MDDLDHSMRIAEYDWASFYEESEECGLLQPSLACPDILSLSDSEDSENLSLLHSAGRQEPQQSPAVSSEEDENNTAGCCVEKAQINQSSSGGNQGDLTTKAWGNSEICLHYPEETETNDNITTTLQTEQLNVQSSEGGPTELKKEEENLHTGSDTCQLKQETDPLSCSQTELKANEPHAADGAVSEDVSTLRAEKERWFVTVNDNRARQRARPPSVKKKRRQKKPCKDNRMCRTPRQEKSLENGLELKTNKDNNKSEKGTDTVDVTQSNQNLNNVNKSGDYSNSEENISDLWQVSGEEDYLSEKLVTSHPPIENITEPTTDRNKHDPGSQASTLHSSFSPKGPPRWDSVESDDQDSVEFLSTHSYDSESYLSATESVEETQHFPMENQQPQSSLSLTRTGHPFNLTENTDAGNTQDRETCSDHTTPSSNATATNSEGYGATDVEPTPAFPSAGQNTNKMPDDSSTCDNDTHSTLLGMPSDTPGLQKHEINLSASGGSSGDRFSPLPVPDLTVTPCSVPDSPETYAKAAGDTRPVYAISAFWDEMEKLTINDILQLRIGRSTPPRETQETVTPNVEDPSSLVDTVESNLSDGGLMDTSDTTDSDYFTQPDDSKPDRSSCEFSTSDFEEEYWQFLGASRNPSPDPQTKNHQSTSASLFSPREEEESTSSEGKETPVPLEFEGRCFEDEDSNASLLSELARPRRIIKTKSVSNVKALNTEDLSLQLFVGKDEKSPLSSSFRSLEENTDLKPSDSLGTLIHASFLSNMDILDEHTQICLPEESEYLFTEYKAKRDSWCVAVYDPGDMSEAPVFDYTLCTFGGDIVSFSPLHDSQCGKEKPIPIFSCSHPTVRELAFPNPNYVFLSADCEEEDGVSPIRVVSRSFMQGHDFGTCAAAPRGFHSWKGLLSARKVSFHDKGSIWCRSGAWVFPVEAEKIDTKRADPPATALTERRVSSPSPSQLFRELAVQQRILEVMQTTRQEGIFSTLKQSDMCLVCIAFASWVLRSSDPEADDAWKAALLANVSALSAIQYLRQYVKKNPSQDGP